MSHRRQTVIRRELVIGHGQPGGGRVTYPGGDGVGFREAYGVILDGPTTQVMGSGEEVGTTKTETFPQ